MASTEGEGEDNATIMVSRSDDPQPALPSFLEVTCKNTGKVWRFPAGTESGFAVHVINHKLDDASPPALYIESVKQGEEPVVFGCNAALVNYGRGWKLQTVVGQGNEQRRTSQVTLRKHSVDTAIVEAPPGNGTAYEELDDADFFNDSKVKEMAKRAIEFNLPGCEENRKIVACEDGGLHDPSVLVFTSSWAGKRNQHQNGKFSYPPLSGVKRPEKEDDIAFMNVLELAELIKTKQITSLELTKLFLRRLKRYGPILEAVITEDLAISQAKRADELLNQGCYLGPLHGIPYGLKDTIAVPHYKTTWGSRTFKDQVINQEAWVYKRLKAAGAVLVAKLSTGSLAYLDVWFGGRTRNPWNIEEGSTGSSAGSAAGTSAALVPFAIASETAGSITFPGARCGITGFRPTFGAVGRSGVMSVSASLDKLGPFCRSAADCAVILDLIRGKDPDDLSSRDISFDDPFSVDITKLTVGYLKDAEMEVAHVLASMGVNTVPFELNYTITSVQSILNFTMDVEMLASFDMWQRLGHDDHYEVQQFWPARLRMARLVPAVDYVQAQRARGKLIQEISKSFMVDAFIGNVTDWERVCLGNLVSLPVIVIPTGFKSIENPPKEGTHRRTAITTGIYAPPEHDHIALALAMAYQSITNHHKQRPPIDDELP